MVTAAQYSLLFFVLTLALCGCKLNVSLNGNAKIESSNPPVVNIEDHLLIPIGMSAPLKNTGNLSFSSILGGGSVVFNGHLVYNDNETWGPHQLFDGTTSIFDWCNLTGEPALYGDFTFPKSVTIKKIFVVPRDQQDNFPTNIEIKVDGQSIGIFTPTTIAPSDGLSLNYSGPGYYITPNTSGTNWRFEFNSDTDIYIGEMELWGQ